MKFIIRQAELSDVNGISAIHCSDILEWYKRSFDEDGRRQRIPAPLEDLTIVERWQMGGAWMAPELCAIHINKMLLTGQMVLVAVAEDNTILSELEMYLGKDVGFGKNANLSVFYTLREARGQGIGTELLAYAIEILKELNYDSLTTYDPDVPEFYAKMGLKHLETLQKVVVPIEVSMESIEFPSLKAEVFDFPPFSYIESLPLAIGRILSSKELHNLLEQEAYPGAYSIDLSWRPDDYCYRIMQGKNRSLLVFRDNRGQREWASVHLWSKNLTKDYLGVILREGAALGFKALHFIIDEKHLPLFADLDCDPVQEGTKIHYLDLKI